MKKKMIFALMAGCVWTSLNAANFDVGISGSDRGINGFSLSIGDYYRVPQQEVMVIERSIPREEMSVVYYLARESHRDARYITDMRVRGLSWWDITFRLGLDPRMIYVVDNRYHKHHGYRLRDAEIIDRVNVRFLSDYHHISPDEVIQRHRNGEKYMIIDEHYRGDRDRHDDRIEQREERRDDRDQRRDDHQDDRRSHFDNDGRDRNDNGRGDHEHGRDR